MTFDEQYALSVQDLRGNVRNSGTQRSDGREELTCILEVLNYRLRKVLTLTLRPSAYFQLLKI